MPLILTFYDQINKSGSYKRNNTSVKLTDESAKTQKLEDAIWCFNKVRDTFAHGNYYFDFKNECIVIDVEAEDGSYSLKCEIPIKLLNISVFLLKENLSKLPDNWKEQMRDATNIMENDFDMNSIMCNDLIVENIKDNNTIKNTETIYEQEQYINIEESLNNLSNTELNKVVSLLTEYKETEILSEDQMNALQFDNANDTLYNNIKKMLYNDDNVGYVIQTEVLIEKIKNILKLRKSQNSNAIVSLYNYMSLVFSQTETIDYSKIKTNQIKYQFIPSGNGGGTSVNYNNTIASIKGKCEKFNANMESQISNYDNSKNSRLRKELMDYLLEFYIGIMESLGIMNKYVVDSLRNAVEHGNYEEDASGNINMHDQTDQNDDTTIKFKATATPQALFNLSKQIESNKSEEFTLGDFVQQLQTILEDQEFKRTLKNLNALSMIIFGKELNLDYTIENMYRETVLKTMHLEAQKMTPSEGIKK